MPSNTMREAEFDVSPIRAATGAVTLLRPPIRTTGAQLPQLAPLPVDRGR